MARKLIDISVPLQNDVPPTPGGHPTIQYRSPAGPPRMLQFFDGLKPRICRMDRLGGRASATLHP
jgi:hypothetical protein